MASWPVGEVWLVHDGFGGHVFQFLATEKDARFVERFHRQNNPAVRYERHQIDAAGRTIPANWDERETGIPGVEQFKEQIEAEASKAIEKGYTPEHDREHGADHLLNWAVEYARLGKAAASANLVQAARAVLAEIVAELDEARRAVGEVRRIMFDPTADYYDELREKWNAALDAAVMPEAAQQDEHHTLEELYDYRMLYNALAFNAWASAGSFPVVKSWRHSNGELCFGGGWFIVVATLPTGQVSNHYSAEHWPLFQVPEAAPPEYDGHTPEVAAQRMRDLLAPVPAVIPQARSRCEYVDPDEGRCLLLDEHTDDHWPSMAALSAAEPTNGSPS